jgi:V/A-type H+/Na+-transporting ATPase subunit G/H
MAESALEEIKIAENDAEKLTIEANEKKNRIISDARAKAAQFLKERADELANKKAQSIERQKEKALAARQKVLDEGEEKLRTLQKSADKKMEDATALILESFDKEIS